MINELHKDIMKANGAATLLAPGPSTEIMPDELHTGPRLSLNNIREDVKYQLLFDPIESESDVVMYHDVVEDIPESGHVVHTEDFGSWSPLYRDEAINGKCTSVASGLAVLLMHGATEIRILGQDGCDPFGEGYSRWKWKPRNEHYFDLIAANHRRVGMACIVADREHGADIYNFSPFSHLNGTKRIFRKYGHTEAYHYAQV